MQATGLTKESVAETTLGLLKVEEMFLNSPREYSVRSTRQYRECYVQFLLWRKLRKEYDAATEERWVDITVGPALDIEMKGPWDTNAPNKLKCVRDVSVDFLKLVARSQSSERRCYFVLILHGDSKAAIGESFDRMRSKALDAAALGPGCRWTSVVSNPMNLNRYPGNDSNVQQVIVMEFLPAPEAGSQ